MSWQKKKISLVEISIILLVVFVPMHKMLFDIIIKGNLDNLWRDILLIVCFVGLIFVNNKKIRLGRYGISIALMWGVVLIYTVTSDRVDMAFNLARTYLIPTLIYFIIINSNISQERLKKIEDIFILVATALSIFGMFQAFVLGDEFLVQLGYNSNGNHLASNAFYIGGFYGNQRVTSTLAAPNICGIYFGIAIIVLYSKLKEKKVYKYFMIILILGLITTFSRSAILGTIFAFLIYYKNNRKQIKHTRKEIINIIAIILVGISIALILDKFLLDNLITRMIQRSFTSTVTMTDASAQKHLSDLWEPLNIIFTNPLGLGFGHNGPIVLAQYKDANLVESSIYLLAYDFGIIGMIIYVFPYIAEIFRGVFTNNKAVSPAMLSLVMITYLLLPNVETFEIIFFAYFFMGLSELKEKNENGEKNEKNY
ncbi:MAG: hypothetical protein HFJ58_01670 [Clostridia bacterium]|nr:hypothetical protein [Clostridia bacterium]